MDGVEVTHGPGGGARPSLLPRMEQSQLWEFVRDGSPPRLSRHIALDFIVDAVAELLQRILSSQLSSQEQHLAEDTIVDLLRAEVPGTDASLTWTASTIIDLDMPIEQLLLACDAVMCQHVKGDPWTTGVYVLKNTEHSHGNGEEMCRLHRVKCKKQCAYVDRPEGSQKSKTDMYVWGGVGGGILHAISTATQE